MLDMKCSVYKNQRIAVVGFGRTGKAALDFFIRKKCYRELSLFNDTPLTEPALIRETAEFEKAGVRFITGSEHFDALEAMDIIILSPGVNGLTPRFQTLREKGVEILSEIEFASKLIEAPIIAVTGTNGKSTTVSLIWHFLARSGMPAFLAGNIGAPLIAEVEKISPEAVVVLEVSSFQLEEIRDFKPHIAAILNVTPDHLDRYDGMDSYFRAKLNIARNQKSGDYIILNGDDPLLTRHKEEMGGAARIWFSRYGGCQENSVCIENGDIRFRVSENGLDEVIDLSKNPLRGVHNLENIMAAAAAVRLMGVSSADISRALEDFRGLPHRMELSGVINKVEFINDSKATNVDAALKSIEGVSGQMALILGGKDKGGDFTLLRDIISRKVRHVLLVGRAAPVIRKQLSDLEDRFIPVSDFRDAVVRGYELLKDEGGVVLLAPGCASFDMFNNFEHRGDVFKEEVLKLAEEIAGTNPAALRENH